MAEGSSKTEGSGSQDIIRATLGPYLVDGKKYPVELPKEIAPWYCYLADSGHNVLALLVSSMSPGLQPDSPEILKLLCPVPVKTVLRSYERFGPYVLVDVPYSERFGLMPPDGDDEY